MYEKIPEYTRELEALNKHYNGEANKARFKDGADYQLRLAMEVAAKTVDKNLEGLEEIDARRKLAESDFSEYAKKLLGENYEQNSDYIRRAAELQKKYDKEVSEHKKALEEKQKATEYMNTWLSKNLSSVEKLKAEKLAAEKEMRLKTLEYMEYGYATESDLIKANAELELYYQQEIASAKMSSLQEYWQQNADLAASQGDYGAQIGYQFLASTADTDVGKIISAAMNGGSVWGAVISIIVQCVASLESFRDALNFIQYIIKKIFEPLDEILKDSIQPIMRLFDRIAAIITKILPLFIALATVINTLIEMALNPILDILDPIADAFLALYNDILVPFLNLFGMNLKKVVVLTEEQRKALEESQAALEKVRERLSGELNELLNQQISSLKSQYELGLISREDYTKQKNAYQDAADKAQKTIEELSYEELQAIADAIKNGANYTDILNKIKGDTGSTVGNTDKISDSTKDTASNTANIDSGFKGVLDGFAASLKKAGVGLEGVPGLSGALSIFDDVAKGKWGEVVKDAADIMLPGAKNFGDIVEGVATGDNEKIIDGALNAATGGLYGIGKKIGSWFGWWDVGSYDIPEDQFGMVHKGETIIPRTFAEGIRNGEFALVGGDRSCAPGKNIYVRIDVGGSVVTEHEITDLVYNGIARGIRDGEYTPLPEAA